MGRIKAPEENAMRTWSLLCYYTKYAPDISNDKYRKMCIYYFKIHSVVPTDQMLKMP